MQVSVSSWHPETVRNCADVRLHDARGIVRFAFIAGAAAMSTVA
jgi:hypothetical protein